MPGHCLKQVQRGGIMLLGRRDHGPRQICSSRAWVEQQARSTSLLFGTAGSGTAQHHRRGWLCRRSSSPSRAQVRTVGGLDMCQQLRPFPHARPPPPKQGAGGASRPDRRRLAAACRHAAVRQFFGRRSCVFGLPPWMAFMDSACPRQTACPPVHTGPLASTR